MNSKQVRYVVAICFVLVSLLAFEVSGWEKQKTKKPVTVYCGDQTLAIDPNDGVAAPNKAIYVCAGDVITWDPGPNHYQFKVHFTKKSPFVGGTKDFDNNSPPPTVKGDINLTVYEYEVTVNGKKADDPQVIGGGGHEN